MIPVPKADCWWCNEGKVGYRFGKALCKDHQKIILKRFNNFMEALVNGKV